MTAAPDAWIQTHPFLEPMARFQRIVEEAALDAPAALPEPRWEAYARDHAKGIPLLQSPASGIDVVAPAAEALLRVCDRVADADLPPQLHASCRALRDDLRRTPEAATRAAEWLVTGSGEPPPSAGLVRFLGWMGLRPALVPIVAKYDARRESDEAWRDVWTKGYCPTCGTPPTMAQLAEVGAGRKRTLACGACACRWSFRRIGCPFCGNESPDRLEALEVEGGEPLRIDHCQECNGYLKTYTGHGKEDLFLADWTTLHLDALAKERGFERKAASLYAL